jgi:hypothetical protein
VAGLGQWESESWKIPDSPKIDLCSFSVLGCVFVAKSFPRFPHMHPSFGLSCHLPLALQLTRGGREGVGERERERERDTDTRREHISYFKVSRHYCISPNIHKTLSTIRKINIECILKFSAVPKISFMVTYVLFW